MKRKHFQRILSIILAVILVLQMSPLQSFAATETTGSDAEETANSSVVSTSEQLTSGESTDQVYVVGEVTELRTEYEKHYRLSDGSFLLTQFQAPIHYEDNGQWIDIDNTLLSMSMLDGTQFYQATNGNHTHAFAANLSNGLILSVAQDDVAISMHLWNGENTNVQSGEVSIESTDNYIIDQSGEIDIEAVPFNRESTVQILTQSSELLTLGTNATTQSGTTDDLVPDNLKSSVLYEDVYPGVDIQYDTYGYNIKESIVLKGTTWQGNDVPNSFTFLLELTGLYPLLQDDGSILLLDESNQTKFTIPAPYMWDNSGAYSNNVFYRLEQYTSGWLLTIQADETWLKDENREYPVTIDPPLFEDLYDLLGTCSSQKGDPSSITSSGHIL